MQASAIVEVLSRNLPDAQFDVIESRDGMPTISVASQFLVDTCLLLRDAPELRFVFLADVVAVDYYPREPRFELVYVMACPGVDGYGTAPKRLRLKVSVPSNTPVPTLSHVWRSANWGERETYDLYGIEFTGHPDLRRILMPDDWEGFPMRKDYPVQINQKVKTYEPLQVTEEEFVANVEQARHGARPSRPKE
jgi:NADH-quinone oxidoreductase subunit C